MTKEYLINREIKIDKKIEVLKHEIKKQELLRTALRKQCNLHGVVGQSEQLPKNNRCFADPSIECDCDTICVDTRS
jgi:hypothetical protein